MAAVTPETVTSAGIEATAHAASAGGDTVPPDVIIRVVNGSASPVTLTIATPGTVDGDLAIPDRTVTVPAGEARLVKPNAATYQNPATGRVALSWSATTDVTFEVVK